MSHLSRTIALAFCIAALALPCSESQAGLPALGSGQNSSSAQSWVAGGHAGYNWQQGSAVFGFETDLQATGLKNSMNGGLVYPPFPPHSPNDFATTTSAIDWYGTARGRIGYANGPWMVYGTAGFAYGYVNLSSLFRMAGVTNSLQASEVKGGWVGGVGFEYLVRPDLVFTLGYQYVDLGSLSATGTTIGAFNTASQRVNVNAQLQTVMAGLSWRFAAGSTSMPWQGGYAGIHGGGAWGANTDARYDSSFLAISDARLKRDVMLLGRRNDGLGIYAYKYLLSDAVHVGVMAQEVALIHPAAVVRDELTGYMAVNYGMLDGH